MPAGERRKWPGAVWRHGPALTIMVSIVLVLALGFGAFGLAWLSPQRTGLLGQEYAAPEAYAFDRLELRTEYLSLDIEAGVIVPVLSRDEITAALVFGLGWARLWLPQDLATEFSRVLGRVEFKEDFEVMYLPSCYQAVERIKQLSSARPVKDPEHVRLAQDILDQQVQDVGLLRSFWRPISSAAANPTAVRIYTVTYGRVDYLEGPRVTMEIGGAVPRRASAVNPGRAAPAFPQLYAEPVPVTSVVLYMVLAGLLWLLGLVLTLHLRDPEWVARAARQGGGLPLRRPWLPGTPFMGLLPVVCLVAGMIAFRLVGAAVFGQTYPLYWADVALALVAAFWLWRQEVPPEHVGLTRRGLGNALVSGGLVGFYVVVAGSIGYPSGVRPLPWAEWLAVFLRSVLLVAPAREFVQRALVQTSLERYVGRTLAVVVTAFAGGLSYLAAGLLAFGPARQLQPLLLEGLVVLPVTNALAGFTYLRTRNLLAPSLVQGMAEFLPHVLMF